MSFKKLLAAACLLALVGGISTAPPAAATGSGMFQANVIWHGNFGAPSVLKVGNTYWAYGTTTGGDNLPAMHSSDLRTWRVRAAYPSSQNPGWWGGYNDAMPHPARWALYYIHRNGRAFTSLWAPSVARVNGRYVAAYAVAAGRPGRHCISTAVSSSPAGPFTDTSTAPIVCASDPSGSIDPQVLTPGDGMAYLIWKNAGVPGSTPSRIWSRQLSTQGQSFASGSRAHVLLATARPWEGNIVENPAMIHYGSQYFLFYSGNAMSPRYATGYATCAGPLGPCQRPAAPGPLVASDRNISGPGGATPVIGPSGGLRLAYAAWDAGHTQPSDPLKLHVGLLSVGGNGLLHVVARG